MKKIHSFISKLMVIMSVTALVACSGGGGGGGGGNFEAGQGTPAVVITGTVNGKALDAVTGQGVAGAAVTYSTLSTTTAADGSFTLSSAPVSSNAVIKIEKINYAIGFATTAIEQDKTATTQAVLTKVAISAPLGIASGGTISDPNSAAQVTLPANGLVDSSGSPATGNVTVNLSVIDPKSNAAAMPGDYTTNTGATIESFGAIKVTLLSSNNQPLNLASGQTATIRIPVSSVATPDASIPLFYFNETSGKWVQEGSAQLKGTAPQQYYEGTVTHFTYWNADRPLETIYVNGCLKNIAGLSMANHAIESLGVDYTGSSYTMTNTAGQFRVAIKKDAKAVVYATLGSNIVSVGPSSTDITLVDCLVLDAVMLPTIVTQPTSVSVLPTGYASMSVIALPKNVQYQWFKNGTSIAGANYSSLSINGAMSASGDSYYVRVSNAAGSVNSQAATVTLLNPTITVYQEPVSVSVAVGGIANFAVLAVVNNNTTPTYQWRRNGSNIAGATSSTYSIASVTAADNGAVFSVLVTSGGATATISAGATLTVTQIASQLTPLEQMRSAIGVEMILAFATAPFDDYATSNSATYTGVHTCTTGTEVFTLDGTTPANGTVFPTGSHQIKVLANNCINLNSISDGSSSIAYTATTANGSPINGTATSTLTNYRQAAAGFFDATSNGTVDLNFATSITSVGSGTTSSSTSKTQTLVLTPGAGTTNKNNTTTRVLTMVSGSATEKTITTTAYDNNVFSYSTTETQTYNNLTYMIAGDTLVMTGTITDTYSGTTGLTASSSGQINVYRNGILVGFIFTKLTNGATTTMININGVESSFF